QYAREKLVESGEAETLRDRHLDLFRRLAEAAAPRLRGREQLIWLDRLETENDNLRAALEWAAGVGRAEAGLAMAGALGEFWGLRGYWSEGRAWLEKALAQAGSSVDPPSVVRAQALRIMGLIASNQGDSAAGGAALAESVELFRAAGDQPGLVGS